jgi:hypothetical protein
MKCICPTQHRRPVDRPSESFCAKCRDAGCTEKEVGARCPGWKSRPRFPNVQPVKVDDGPGAQSASEGEFVRNLLSLQRQGYIENLQRQQTWEFWLDSPLTGQPFFAGTWRADAQFTVVKPFLDFVAGQFVVADSKYGKTTQAFGFQSALMEHCHGIKVWVHQADRARRYSKRRRRRQRA